MTGCSYAGSTSWREYVADQLNAKDTLCLSPMRGKECLKNELNMTCNGYPFPLTIPRASLARDRFDCTRCDVLLVNLLGATQISIGTVIEMAWAHLKQIPIVCAIEKDNIHHHALLSEMIDVQLETLDDAITCTKAIIK